MVQEPRIPHEEDLQSFIDDVDDVSRLIEGLKSGTISPDYIDTKIQSKKAKEQDTLQGPTPHVGHGGHVKGASPQQNKAPVDDAKAKEEEEARKQKVMAKVEELKASRWKKLKARERYEDYVRSRQTAGNGHVVSTDYAKWDMYCPDDDEDDLFNSLTPNAPEFRAMEKDIETRHKRMVEQRQLAERQRVAGNTAFKAGQFSEALRCYEIGIESQKTSMALHGNAAMAALKLNCFVQAIEHCDKVLNIADFLHSNLQDPLCVKAYQRRATAYRALQQFDQAVKDMEAAAAIEPTSKEVQTQLAKARLEAQEHRKAKTIKKMLSASGDAAAPKSAPASQPDGAFDLDKLRRIEELVRSLQPSTAPAASDDVSGRDTCGTDLVVSEPSTSGRDAAATPQPRIKGLAPLSRPPSKTAAVAAAAAAAAGETAVAAGGSVSNAGGTDGLAAACQALRGLLGDDDSCCVYFRECGGLQAAAQLTSDGQRSVAVAELLLLLNAASWNDGNLEKLPTLAVLPVAVKMLASPHAPCAAAAATLLCTAATNADVRKAISVQLAAPGALAGPLGLLKASDASVQGVVLTLLGNCMVDKPVKDALSRILNTQAAAATTVATADGASLPAATAAAVASSHGSGGGGSSSPLATFEALLAPGTPSSIVERTLTLLGNMCGDVALRASLPSHSALLQRVLDLFLAAVPTATGSTASVPPGAAGVPPAAAAVPQLAAAAGTLLYNLALDEAAQAAVLAGGRAGQLLPLIESEDLHRASRAACILSRLSKHPAGKALLSRESAVKVLVEHGLKRGAPGPAASSGRAAADTHVPTAALSNGSQGDASPSAPSAPDSSLADAATAMQDAAVRILAQLTADTDAVADQLLSCGGAAVLLEAMKGGTTKAQDKAGQQQQQKAGQAAAGQGLLGNAALVLGNIARRPARLAALRLLDPVAPLVKVAYDGKGNPASKNAAIALARLAQDPAMMERLRELHGLEIIYQYVKP